MNGSDLRAPVQSPPCLEQSPAVPAVYKSMADAMRKHPQADVMVNFASLRSAYESVVETMQYPQVGRSSYIGQDWDSGLLHRS